MSKHKSNWFPSMKTAALILMAFSVQSASAATSELFMSEYIEGSSNNKAIEIYNSTGAAVDLAAGGYAIIMYFNGNTSSGLTINRHLERQLEHPVVYAGYSCIDCLSMR